MLGMKLLKTYKAVLPGEGLEAGATDGEKFDLCGCWGLEQVQRRWAGVAVQYYQPQGL